MSNDHRSTWTQAQCDSWSHAASLFRQLADAEGLTTTQLALLFCLSNKDIRYVIPGAMNVLEVAENWQTAQLSLLSKQCLDHIRAIYSSHDFTPIKSK